MLLLTNVKHTLLEKITTTGKNGKTYYSAKFSNDEGFFITLNCNEELFNRLEKGKQYILCVNYRVSYNRDTNTVRNNMLLVEIY